MSVYNDFEQPFKICAGKYLPPLHKIFVQEIPIQKCFCPELFLKTPAAEGSFDRPGWPVEVSLVCKHIVLPKCLRLFPPHAEQIRTP